MKLSRSSQFFRIFCGSSKTLVQKLPNISLSNTTASNQKGIESIIAHLGKGNFYRVRVGIGRPDIAEDEDIDKEQAVIDYVLSGFTREEKKIINKTIPEVSKAILCLLIEGIDAAMNEYN